MIKEITFVKDITRIDLPLTEVKIWAKGECEALHNLIGFGFSHHLFVGHNGSLRCIATKKNACYLMTY